MSANPSGLETLYDLIGRDLSELSAGLTKVLESNEGKTVVFNSHAGDNVHAI